MKPEAGAAAHAKRRQKNKEKSYLSFFLCKVPPTWNGTLPLLLLHDFQG
jgi:hypothetical protein